jgi:hypothetical protein
MMTRYSLALIALLMAFGAACKSSSPKSPAKKSSNQVPADPSDDDDSAIDNPSTDNCSTNSSSNDEDEGLDLRGLFGLQDTKVTYESDIKSILSANCTSCHSGGTEPDISSFAAAKNAATSIAASVKSGAAKPMPPPSGGLSSGDQEKLQQWITDGLLERAESGSSSDDDDDSNSSDNSSNSDCNDNDSSSNDSEDNEEDDSGDDSNVVADWEEFLNPERLKECKDEGKVFDRVQNDCHKAKIAEFTCEKAAIIDKYKAFESAYDSIIDDGYVLDQCGDFNGDPIILFYKKNETSSELKLKIRKLCKKDSPACST